MDATTTTTTPATTAPATTSTTTTTTTTTTITTVTTTTTTTTTLRVFPCELNCLNGGVCVLVKADCSEPGRSMQLSLACCVQW